MRAHESPTPDPGAMPGMDGQHGMPMSPGPSPSGMAGMSGMDDMGGMSGMGPNIMPAWVNILWMAALAAVLVFHCLHLARMGGQHRWFHGIHILMLIGMIYMFATMTWNWNPIPGGLWMALYVITTAGLILWMAVRMAQRRPFSWLWLLALVQQAAMIYMFAPGSAWTPGVSYALAFYFLIEALLWLLGICNDAEPGRRRSIGPGPRDAVVPLGHGDRVGNLAMAVMAGSMAYMFLGMQLMM